MKNHEQVERELLEQCSQIATLVECFAWLQRCDECIERLEELRRAKRPRLAVRHRQSAVARIARVQKCNWSDVSCTLVASTRVKIATKDLSGDAAFESRISTAVINSNHIEPRRFLEDAKAIVFERVRDAVERHDSAKVNTAFNGEFVTKDKRAHKSIIIKEQRDIPIHRFARVV